jgi:hypothetical protein
VQRICVFCGSRPGAKSAYREAAIALGTLMAAKGYGLVYGGASVGLMGAVADAVLAKGGEVIGVIPESLVARELAHGGLSELYVVRTMHERKALMAERSDAFIALPGGFGTFEELFEVVTWAQLGIHRKPVGLLDVAGYYGPLQAMLRHGVEEGFVPESHEGLCLFGSTPEELIGRMETFQPPDLGRKWVTPSEL